MKIRIVQRKYFFLTSKYEIFINGKIQYRANSEVFTLRSKIKIKDLNDSTLYELKRFFFSDKRFLNFQLIDLKRNKKAKIKSKSFIEHIIIAQNLEINCYEQKGNDIGLFIHGNQVGILSKNKKKKLNQDIYDIEISENLIEPELIIGFCLSFDYTFHNDSSISFTTVDYGNKRIKPIIEVDPKWKDK